MHGNGDYDEILQVEKNALEDEGVKEALKKLQLPAGTVVCADPWIYGKFFLPRKFFVPCFWFGLSFADRTPRSGRL